MLCTNINGKQITARNADNPIANPVTINPKIIPNIDKNIFMEIAQIIPSISQEKITPGILMDQLATPRNTSPTNEPEIMQYKSANIA